MTKLTIQTQLASLFARELNGETSSDLLRDFHLPADVAQGAVHQRCASAFRR
jgi:hypothetical protein